MKNTARFELTRLTRALASCSVLSLVPGLAMPQTLPTGLNVTTGSAQVNTQGSTMTVTNSAGAVLNWQSFNIGQGAAVRFEQPNAASQVLNRVLGNDPSAIFGSLSSNGRVWLLNPNGVIFGPSSRVDVAGLVTSTLRLNDADWLAGRFSFTGDAGHNATIVNQGELRTSLGGRVALIGGSVSNQGLIEAPGGQVVLAAGSSVELVDTGAPNLAVKVSAGSGEALNLGTLRAAGGRIDIHAAAVNQSGIVRADSATGNGGSVELRASGRTTLADGSITSASGGAGNGGSVMLLGNEVGLLGSARVDASGSAGGGEVLVGGGWQGKDVRVPNARAVYMGPSASISADATSQGDGGTVVLWGNEASRVYGSLSATGGSTGGNGGRIETSGGWLDAQPTLINVSAPAGASGNWLLDPFNIFISVEAGNSGTTGAPIFTANANDAQINSGTLQTALNAGTNVTITTGGPGNGSQAGNILMQQANINVTAASPGSLSIVADGSLTIEGSSIASTNGAMPVNLTANGAGGISMTNSTIASHNGAINLRAPALTMDASVLNSRAIVDAIVIAGIGNVGMGSFSSTNMVTPLVTPNGRWIAYLGFGIQDFNVGSFNHNFRRVGASFGAWAGDSGNGLVFSQPANLTLSGTASNKVYDGTTTATLNNVSGTGVVGETATLKNGVTGVFNNKNVGTAKPVGFSQADAFNVIDSQNKPVFGYTATGLTANITPLALPLTGITANNRTYTGNLVVTVTGTPTIAPLAGDVVTLSSNISYDLGTNQNNKNVGNNKPVFIRNASLSGADAGNYSLTLPSLTINVTQAPATLVGLTAQNKVYDGTTAASVTGSPSVNLGLDVFELVNVVGTPSASFDNKNAGTGKSVTISGLSLSGTTAGNYFLVANPLTANITPAPLLVSGLIVAPKVYDGTTTAVLSGTPSVSPLAGDVVGVQTGSLTGSFADKNVGSNKTVTLGGGITLTGAAAGNYTAQAPTTLVGTITQRPLELTGITANDRTYTGNLVVTVTGTPTIAPVAGDVVTLSSNISYDLGTNQNNRNVGNNKPVFIRNASLSGADAGNYSLTLPNLTINVTQAPATLVGLTAQNKVYDGTTAASVTGSPTVNLGLDVFELVSVVGTPSASFDNKNAGTGKSVTISGLSLSGTTASNYFLVANPLTATITPAPLLIGGLIVAPKVYDGTTTAVLSGTPSVSPVAGDVVGVQAGSLTGNFADKNVANNKAVTLGGITLTGADAGNYAPQAPTTLVGNITARPLNITGLAGASKVYDGTTSINLAGTAQIDAVAGDNVSLAGSLVGSFDTKNAGVNKPISLTGLSLSGSDSTNYALVQPAGLFGSITQRALTVSGLGVANKTYDGTITASLVTSGASLANVVSGDTVSLATGAASARFADKNAGTGKAVSVSGLGLTGADSGNYTVSAPTGLSANIARATATVTGLGAANKVYDGTTTAQLTGSGSLSGIVSGDVVTLPTSGLTGSFADKNVGNGKAVTLAGLSLAGADAGNYNVVAGSGITANITPRQVTLGGFTAAPRTYNGQTGVALSGGTITNAVSGDNISLTGTATGTMANANAGDAKPVTLGIGGLGLAGTDSGNYTLTGTPAPTGITVNIARADLFYLATAKTVQAGSEIGALTGIVEGFVGTDTLATAAVGTPVFTTTATATSAPGSYAILGGGLTATNYNLLQRPANNTALTLTPAPSASTPPAPATEVVRVLQNIVVAPPPASRESTGMADLSQTAGTSSSSAAGPVARKEDFGTVRLASLSPDAIQQLLASRDRYKKTAFAESISRLSVNPALADLRACANLREAEQGTCLVTEALQRQWAEQKARERPVAAAPTPAPAPAPAPGPAAAPTPAPAPVAAAPAAPAARPGAAPAATPAAERRRVRQAALPQIERKIALVVGVDTYADGAIPPLANSVKDARAMARVFESELGYETVVLENPSRSAVVAALNRLALDTTVLDSVVIYYAGHGELIEATKLGYWQLADADAKKPETWLSNTDIGRLVSRIPASQVALISDSCYSGSLVNEERIRASTSPVDPIAVLTRKTVVVMSSGGNEPVFDAGKNGHSPFAWSLMNTLQQVNNWRPGGQIFERVRFAVARELPQRPQYGASSAAGHQAGGDYLFEQRQLEAR